MTILEKIKNDRAWRGAAVELGMSPDGNSAYRLTHPSGAVAYVYAFAARVQVRHWDAYVAAKAAIPIVCAAEKEGKRCQICKWYSPHVAGKCKRHGKPMPLDPARVKKARVELDHFKKLSGFDLMGEP